MEILFQSKKATVPVVSIVLLDWSCRESYHVLDYLSYQTVGREKFEILWIEYYNRRASEIDLAIRKSRVFGADPPVDKWIVLDMPKNLYYHKHLMYNVGIVASAGEIVTFCDSDAIVRETFVASILEFFEKDRDIVLHLDQVRNREREYYPFSYPSIEEITTSGRNNVVNGKPVGLWDVEDPLHTRNYGACMSALREDLIGIGGADEHVDYLGYVCGPYEMTWRLVNAGKKEVWHESEWIYHTWHPGQLGDRNYFGPHDGSHMSSTALAVRHSGRIMPLVENAAIRELRVGRGCEALKEVVSRLVFSERDFAEWRVSKMWLDLIKLGKVLSRKYLPRSVKTYIRSRIRDLYRVSSHQ